MSLNIKNDEAHRLARAVANRAGETMTEAVIEALRERLARLESGSDVADEHFERLRAISMRAAPRMKGLPAASEVGAMLYDESGLPA